MKRGQELVCIHKGPWIGTKFGEIGIGPVFNEIVQVNSVCWAYPENIVLAGYPFSPTGRPQSFKISWFEPLVEDSVLQQELNSILVLEEC